MEFPVTVESQEQFDTLVRDRLARQQNTLEELKTRAETAEASVATVTQERDTAAQERDTAITRAETAEATVATFEGKEQVATWRTQVAEATGVPAGILRGSTKEDFEAHAAELKPLLTAQESPVLPNQGKTPTVAATTSKWSGVIDALDQQNDTN